MNQIRVFPLLVAAGMLAFVNCSGGGTLSTSETSDVSGTWQATDTNGASAIFANCSGQLSGLNGSPYSALLGDWLACGSFHTSQSGTVYTLAGQHISCTPFYPSPGSGWMTGGGTVNGRFVEGQFEFALPPVAGNTSWIEHYTGDVAGDKVFLTASRITQSGVLGSGACDLSPPLSVTFTVDR